MAKGASPYTVLKDVKYMTLDEINHEVKTLQQQYLVLDAHVKFRDDAPLINEVIQARFKQLHNRACYLLAHTT